MSSPIMRYHGGKFRIADFILARFPAHSCYVEPFGGAASVLMAKKPVGTEVYNDLDDNVVNLFRVLRDPAKAADLANRLRFTAFSRKEFDDAYALAVDDVDAAHKLLIKSFMGFGSDVVTRSAKPGFRAKRTASAKNGGGITTSPAVEFSKHWYRILDFQEKLASVVIESRPAIEVIRHYDSAQTLIYADPPYLTSTRSLMISGKHVSHGYRHEMTDADHRELADCLNNCKGMVVLSGYQSALYDELYSGWATFRKKAMAETGKPRTECLWVNKACADALKKQSAQLQLCA